MPPNLHPRSAHTTTLFTTTLAISFLVVGLPHILPCPVSSRQHLDATTIEEVIDENGRRVRRRVYKKLVMDQSTRTQEGDEREEGRTRKEQELGFGVAEAKDRECPVPKPGGFVGRWFGFDGRQRGEDVVIMRDGKSGNGDER